VTGRAYLDVNGLAEMLGVKPCFIRRLVWERRIPYYKIGKFIRFDLAEVRAWIEPMRHEPLR
jgi:excisionase family DNA binding protein